ncbi:MAG: hypothetical protein NC421_10995 [Lachnospiraceae bacterium]|nr:hypothetical protein [Lachnospiraceae bacterium]
MNLNFWKNLLTAVSVIGIVALSADDARGCGWEPSRSVSRYPAFQFVNTPALQSKTEELNEETVDYWYDYAGGEVGRGEVSSFLSQATYAEISSGKDKNSFYRYLVAKGDTAALNFLKQSLRFSEALEASRENSWDYDSQSSDKLAEVVAGIRVPSQSNPMFERYVFLLVRANAAMHRYDNVIGLWNKYQGVIKNHGLKERLLGYLGGAYYHTGKYVDAISIFAKNGDANSLNWCLSRLVGASNLLKLFDENPNSEAVYYVLQDYMNYLWLLKLNQAEEYNFPFPGNPYRNGAYSAEGNLAGACNAIISMAEVALENPHVEYPQVWATAKAFAFNLVNSGDMAKKEIAAAARLKGTPEMDSNRRRISFWIDFSNYNEGDSIQSALLAKEYNTLYVKARSQSTLASYYNNSPESYRPSDIADYAFLANFVVPYAELQYRDTSLYYRVLVLMDGVRAMNSGQDYWAFEPQQRYTYTLQTKGLKALARMLDDRSGLSQLDKSIFSSAEINPNPIYDALGRVALSLGDYDEAIAYFDRVDVYWMGRQGFYAYLQARYDNETKPFARSATNYVSEDSVKLIGTVNYRADYCRRLRNLKTLYDNAPSGQKPQLGYEYAAALFQASAQGDLWAISNNMWSVGHLVDALSDRSASVLEEVSRMKAPNDVKARIYYGIASIQTSSDGSFYEMYDYRNRWNWDRFSPARLRAYAELAKLYTKVDDRRITGCDVLRSYISSH